MMDLDGETQLMMDLDCETQVVEDIGGETQVMDVSDDFERNETQLFDGYDTEEFVVSDCEGSDKTEIVYDSDEFCDEVSGRRDCANSADVEGRMVDTRRCKEDVKACKTKTDCGRSDQHTSGSWYFEVASLLGQEGLLTVHSEHILLN